MTGVYLLVAEISTSCCRGSRKKGASQCDVILPHPSGREAPRSETREKLSRYDVAPDYPTPMVEGAYARAVVAKSGATCLEVRDPINPISPPIISGGFAFLGSHTQSPSKRIPMQPSIHFLRCCIAMRDSFSLSVSIRCTASNCRRMARL